MEREAPLAEARTVAKLTELLVHLRKTAKARRQELSDGPFLWMRNHVLEQLNRGDGKRKMVAFAVPHCLEEIFVREGLLCRSHAGHTGVR